MSLEIQENKKRLHRLKSFLDRSKFTEGEIVEWVSDCVGLFSTIGVSEIIVQGFLRAFENHLVTEKTMTHKFTLPVDVSGIGDLRVFYFGPFERFSGGSSYSKGLFNDKSFLYLKVALKTSEDILNKIEDSERVIPKSLIDLFDGTSLENIKTTLEIVQSKYEDKDPRGMISPLITATQNILNLIPEVRSERKISKQILKLYDNPDLQKKYSLNKDVLWGMNTARIVRNEEVEHQKKEHEGVLNFVEIVGYTHLLVLSANSLFASGAINIK